MAAVLPPRRWAEFPQGRDAMFQAMRSGQGEHLVLAANFFIETVLPKSSIRPLSEQEMDAYRAPFRARDAPRPTLIWPRELPIEGEPADVVAIVARYGEWLSKGNLPTLLICAEPGAILVGRAPHPAADRPINERSRCKGFASSRKMLRTRSVPRCGIS